MSKVKNCILKYGTSLSALALMIGIASINSACLVFYHQPKVPKAMNRFKK